MALEWLQVIVINTLRIGSIWMCFEHQIAKVGMDMNFV